jgi:hypothetical protein
MSELKAGDQVVCVVEDTQETDFLKVLSGWDVPVGAVCTVFWVGVIGCDPVMTLVEYPLPRGHFYQCRDFRKVERRNDSLSIEAFLTIKPDQFEGPTRKAPAKKREKV